MDSVAYKSCFGNNMTNYGLLHNLANFFFCSICFFFFIVWPIVVSYIVCFLVLLVCHNVFFLFFVFALIKFAHIRG